MRKNLTLIAALFIGCLVAMSDLYAQNPLSHPACGSGASASTVCLPFACDDGDPSTINDLTLKTCEGTICTPCAGTPISVTNIEVKNMRDCGGDLCGSNKFTADIEITFDYTPVYRDFIITGDVYFSYDETYCEYNENSITIKDQCFEADGDVIGLNVIFNNNPALNYRKRWVGYALDGCGTSSQGHRVGHINSSTNAYNHDLALAPNPAQNEVNIILKDNFTGMANLEVFDLTGKLQLSRNINLENASTNLDISSLGSGIYLVKVATENFSWTKRLIKSN